MRCFLITIFIMFFSIWQVHSQENYVDELASKIYLKHLKVIKKKTKKHKFGDEKYEKSLNFLENITKIKSFIVDEFNCYGGGFSVPIKENILDWERWHKLNKNNLVYDKASERVYLKQAALFIIKDPVEVYNSYLSVIDLDYSKRQNINADIYDSYLYRLQELTGYKETNKVLVLETIPTKYDILFFKQWIEECKDDLEWDFGIFDIKLKDSVQ